ncbi:MULTISPECIES: zinc metalloprotease TldD [Acidianus]|uniref:zinc metalloprotease TldD n=1 Tax=Acidianus TaxID=12914 RepID=UPI000A8F027A|nr:MULTISPECIES: zinc metalloprotease TldD [Acidianus]
MLNLLRRAEELGSVFADLRSFYVDDLSLNVSESREYVQTNGIESGHSLRVLYNGNWGYSSFVNPGSEEVKRAIDSAYGDEKVNIVYLPPKHDEVKIRPKKEVNKGIEEIRDDLRKIKEKVMQDSRVKAISVRYFNQKVRKEYYSTEDREILQEYSLSGVYLSAVAFDSGVMASAYYGVATYEGYPLEVFDENSMVDIILKRINNQLKGKVPTAGESEVILSPDVVGVFSHEALGHLAEADLAVNGILYPLRGKKIAPDFVTIVDSPRHDLPMSIGITPYDDEGVEGREIKILDNGIVSEFLVDRYFAVFLGQRPSGNARAEDFRSPVLIRMRNTYMYPGKWSVEEMISEIKDGYLVVSPLGGQTSPDGTFQFGIQEGYRIEKGEVKEPLRNFGIAGYTLETLGRIEAVSKNFDMWPGFCGKGGQSVPVGTGGPHVKVKVKVGGNA